MTTASCEDAKPLPPSKPTSRGEKCGADVNDSDGAEESGGETESATLPCGGGARAVDVDVARRPGCRATRVL
jgi:hypothetical protein